MARKKTKIALITLVVLTGILLSVFFAYQPYITLAYKEFKYGFASLGPTIRFFTYWVDYYKQLRYNPEQGTYDFEWVVNDPSSLDDLDDYALGVLAWHRGDFTGATSPGPCRTWRGITATRASPSVACSGWRCRTCAWPRPRIVSTRC